MKYLVVLLAFVCNIVFANPIRVEGIGNTVQQAKDNAFKTAVELQVGFVLVNELESNDNKLVRNEIIKYSSGYVDSYKIINSNTFDNKVVIVVDVWVSSSKIADRILGTGTNPTVFNNEKHVVQYETYINSKQNGDRLLNSVLNDYPRKAFIVTTKQHVFGVDIQRKPFIDVEFQFKWNYNYLTSFNEALSLIEDGRKSLFSQSQSNIIVMAKDPNDLILGKKNHYRFNDSNSFDSIKQRFDANVPRIQLTIYNQNNTLFYKNCYIPESFTGTKPVLYSMRDSLIVYGNQTENNIIRLNLSSMTDVMRSIERLELNVVGPESCK